MVIKSASEVEHLDTSAVDDTGKPTTYLSFLILELMFCDPHRWFTTIELTKLLAAKFSDVDSICDQLKQADFLVEYEKVPGQYQYNLNSANSDVQAAFEKFLVEVELESLPVHLMLDYSPSFRSPALIYHPE
jgi:hypothetical protein